MEEGLDLTSDNDLSLHEYFKDQDLGEEISTTKSQPTFFANSGVNAEALIVPSYWAIPDNEEHDIGLVSSNDLPFRGYVARSNNYCFLKLVRDSHSYPFFFKCDLLATNEVYFRVMEDECPYPLVNPPTPPAEEVCYLYAKRAAENVDRIYEAIGDKSEGVLECYISVIQTVTPGNLESICTREAVASEWRAITATELNTLA